MELPVKFCEEMKRILGEEEYGEYLASLEESRRYGLRVNTAKISPEEFEKIAPFPLTKIPYVDNGYYYGGSIQPAKHPYYFAGLYYLQDPSAMTPASRLPVEKGDMVLDLCAAPGGKATELAARLGGTGLLVANDISSKRAKALLKNIELFGVENSFVTTEYPQKLQEHFTGFFDKILIDAPCSGEGMFRKDSSMVKAWEQNGPEFYAGLQETILAQAPAEAGRNDPVLHLYVFAAGGRGKRGEAAGDGREPGTGAHGGLQRIFGGETGVDRQQR